MRNRKKQSRRKPGARNYADYSKEMLEVAADLVRNKVISSYEAEKQFGIPRRTIVNKSKNIHSKSFGRPTEFSTEEEVHIADVVNLSAEFGCPITLLNLRIVVYNYILKSGKDHLFMEKCQGNAGRVLSYSDTIFRKGQHKILKKAVLQKQLRK
ncbi:unnamed protein product [Arctia plantaginis]|uniref:HTH psq-type domain-containing protein n=1 Tax=Arctia plantaginis TaxID=874455 RepID=A0A8S0Z4D4_ARCPL|nr:unnamed protein product [Arctia plantaginis]